MGHRLSKIYTKTGDDGTTGLADGSRIHKDDLRIEAMGSIDELNSVIGVLLSVLPVISKPDRSQLIQGALTEIQHCLFDLGGSIAYPESASRLSATHIGQLEAVLDQLNADLSPLKEFILPGGCLAAAVCHQARSVCRRAERNMVSLSQQAIVPAQSIQYLNRLSDLLFVMARSLNKQANHSDILWNPIQRD